MAFNFLSDVTIGNPRFVGERSFLSFHPPRNVRHNLQVEIQFKPDVETGLLLYMAEHLSERTSDFLSVELYDGFVHLRYNTGTEDPTIVRSSNSINGTDGKRLWSMSFYHDPSLDQQLTVSGSLNTM